MKRIAFPTVLALLACGSARAATLPATDWYATVAEVSGLVRVQTPPADSVKAAAQGDRVNPGDVILTLEGARVRLEFSDGTRTWLSQNTRLAIARPEDRRRGLALMRGFIRLLVAKVSGDAEFGVTTPTAVAAVKGTDFTLAVSDAATDIAVLEGQVLCSDRERRYAVLMRAGETARWDRNGLWEPVRRLSATERTGLAGGDAPKTEGAPLRFGGYVTLDYVKPRAKGARDTFANPWMSLQASSTLGPRAHTFWEIWLTQGGNDQLFYTDHHGRIDVLQAWAETDLLPSETGPSWLTFRAGILPVPVGRINQAHEIPMRAFAGFPFFADWIIPVPWRDLGVQLTSGVTTPAGTLRVQAAVINGLQLESTTLFGAWLPGRVQDRRLWWARPTEDERSFGDDNNANKAFAGRAGWSVPHLSLGGSLYTGKAGANDTNDISIVAGDLAADVSVAGFGFALQAEAGRAHLKLAPGQPAGLWGDWPIAGGYAELEVTPPFAPIALGVSTSPMFERTLSGPLMHVDHRAVLAIRAIPKVVFKVEGQRHRFKTAAGWSDADVFIAQVTAFW